ncbi:tetratricopeptide repeat protein [Brevundimonas sp.]|uniref:tetratricopeptide repeat protein n=1 Tax=Brevundimonas sp. TaxID=1871086 RepID=UPI0037BF4009
MLKVLAAAMTLAIAAMTTTPAHALATAAAADAPEMSQQEKRDHDLFVRANTDFQRRGHAALARHLPALRQALDRMPADYGQVANGDGQSIVRVSDPGDVLIMLVSFAAAHEKGEQPAGSATALPNVYGDITMMLASEAVEARRYEEAVAYLDRTLKVQPQNWMLLSEKAAALQGLARWEEALALADDALASSDLLMALHRGPFHRRRGFSLIELGRLDEAKAAYEAALELDPEDANARRELEYIAQLKAGAPATAPQVIAPFAPEPPKT